METPGGLELALSTTPNGIFNTAQPQNYSKQRNKIIWLTSMTFCYITTPLLIYLVISLSYHGYQAKTMLACGGTRETRAKQAASVVNLLIWIAAIFTALHVATGLPLIGQASDTFCAIQDDVQNVLFGFSVISIYFALWYRVYKVLYRNPLMFQNQVPLILKAVNVLFVVFLFLTFVVELGLFFSDPPNFSNEFGCQYAASSNGEVKWILLVSCTVAFQLLLLLTLTYPLYMHNRKMLRQSFDVSSVIPIVKRAAIITGVCIMSDLMTACFSLLFHPPTTYISHIVYSVNLILNLLGGILSSADWRQKLMPYGCYVQ